jgi:hypothetical protein
VDLVDGLLGGGLIHPLCRLKLLCKLGLDVSDDGVAKLLGFSRKGLLNKESAQYPAHTVVDMAYTLAPPFRCGVRVLREVSA